MPAHADAAHAAGMSGWPCHWHPTPPYRPPSPHLPLVVVLGVRADGTWRLARPRVGRARAQLSRQEKAVVQEVLEVVKRSPELLTRTHQQVRMLAAAAVAAAALVGGERGVVVLAWARGE